METSESSASSYPISEDEIALSAVNWLDRPAKNDGLILTLFWILLQSLFSSLAWKYESIYEYLILDSRAIKQLELHRYLSSAFIHADLRHLLSNLILGSIFFYLLSSYFGPRKIFWGSLGSAFLINYLSYQFSYRTFYLDPHLNVEFPIRLLGSSGVVYFLGSTWLGLYFLTMTRLSIIKRLFKVIGVGLLLFFPTESFDPTISYQTHMMGFALGTLFALVLWFFNRKIWGSINASP